MNSSAQNRKHARIARFEYQMEPEELEDLSDTTVLSGFITTPTTVSWQDNLEDGVANALKTLTDAERSVLLLRTVAGFKYEEIGQELNLPLGSVTGYLARARTKMRSALAQIKT